MTLSDGGTVVTINDDAVQVDDIEVVAGGPYLLGNLDNIGITELIPFSRTTGYSLMTAPSAAAAAATVFPSVATYSVLGNGTGTVSSVGSIGSAADGQVLRRKGSALAFGLVDTTGLDDDIVTDAKLRNSVALSVIGRSANSTGDPADIAAASDGHVLRRSGTSLGFGTVATAGLANDAVTNAIIRDSAALSVIGRSANSTGDPADIAASNDGEVLRRSGTTLGFGTVATAGLGDDVVTNAKAANMKANSIKMRMSGSSGDPMDQDMTDMAANLFATLGFTYTIPCWRLSDGVLGCITI